MSQVHSKGPALKRLLRSWFGRSETVRKRPPATSTVQLDVEQLGDRVLPSTTGVISSITDASGQTTCFAIGQDGGVYYANNGPFVKLSGNAGWFSEVSAGLDGAGHAVCWAIGPYGNLWFFSAYDNYPHDGNVYGNNEGGGCVQISATRNNECFAIGNDGNVWRFTGAGWHQDVVMPGGFWAVQISAGVDAQGQDKAYVLAHGGFVLEENHDGSTDWLQNQWGQFLQASQISAGIGSNGSGRDLWYIASDSTLHYFNGTDWAFGGWACQQISAALSSSGLEYCIVTANNYAAADEVYEASIWGWQDMQRQAASIAPANNDMLFTTTFFPSNQIWCHDPNNEWAAEWTGYNGQQVTNQGDWHFFGGISG
jgi:hypothetical protein